MILLLAALAGIVGAGEPFRRALSPDFLTEFVLYGLWAADLTILLGLTFVLARNVIKLIVERRRALPFARFRGKLVAVLLGMTLVPAVLVLLVGSELIRNSVDRWFNAPVEDVLTAADLIASDYYRDRQVARGRRRRADGARAGGVGVRWRRCQRGARPHLSGSGAGAREDGRGLPRSAGRAGAPRSCRTSTSRRRTCRAGYARAVADRMASHAASGQIEPPTPEPLPTGGELIRAAAVVRRAGSAAADRRRGGQRLSHRRAGGARAPHHRRVRGLQPAARASRGRSPASICRSS